jgi:DNA polymerase III epsilon subunit-like protein
MSKTNEIYISIDIETAGPNPNTYSMLSIGACQVYDPQDTFYIELKPISKLYIPSALAISALDWDHLNTNGIPPAEGMVRFANWVNQLKTEDSQPIFVAFNASFDWMFVNDYFFHFLGYNPFGHKALDIKSYYMGLYGVSWQETGMKNISNRYGIDLELSHHALQDAIDQAKLFRKMLSDSNNRFNQSSKPNLVRQRRKK